MPYIITTKTPCVDGCTAPHTRSRRAVATLKEAREDACVELAKTSLWNNPDNEVEGSIYRELAAECQALPEAGGTVGPLPDGTVIEVERVRWGGDVQAQIDAYNARQGVHA